MKHILAVVLTTGFFALNVSAQESEESAPAPAPAPATALDCSETITVF
jgi:hypothetical protein